MMDFLYRISQTFGYDHPLHPPFTHMPIGLVVGAFIFLLLALMLKRRNSLNKAAYYCIILAFIFLFPAALFGITDWLHYYSGAWLFPIKIKIGLTIALLIFLILGISMEIRNIGGFMSKSTIYLLCVICVTGLGYFGGDLVFADKVADMQQDAKSGEVLYANNCRICHPNGGNIVISALPVINSSKLKNIDEFINYNRNPRKQDGSPGTMPAFSKEKLSDQQLRDIYQYITTSLVKKRA
ncbi:MAG: c-type cytochrome [Smithellaceae bacterium]